jgi:glycosyltransferase involved in cell wall biosynthesis
MATVSVIIPTRNRLAYLQSAITSVLNQTFRDFEILVIDDSSEPAARDAVTSFADQRIKYIRHENNKGVAASRNTGLLNSTSNYIGFLDDDDEWVPEKLAKQCELLKKSPSAVGAVYTGAVAVGSTSRNILFEVHPRARGHIFDDVLTRNSLTPTSTILLRRECVEKVGFFDETLKYGEDCDMWLRISRDFHFDYIDEPLVRISVHDNHQQLSGNYDNYEAVLRSIQKQLVKYAAEFAANRKAHSLRYLALGELYCGVGDIQRGREAFFKAIRLHPAHVRHYYNLGLSFLGAEKFKKFKEIRNLVGLRLHS